MIMYDYLLFVINKWYSYQHTFVLKLIEVYMCYTLKYWMHRDLHS